MEAWCARLDVYFRTNAFVQQQKCADPACARAPSKGGALVNEARRPGLGDVHLRQFLHGARDGVRFDTVANKYASLSRWDKAVDDAASSFVSAAATTSSARCSCASAGLVLLQAHDPQSADEADVLKQLPRSLRTTDAVQKGRLLLPEKVSRAMEEGAVAATVREIRHDSFRHPPPPPPAATGSVEDGCTLALDRLLDESECAAIMEQAQGTYGFSDLKSSFAEGVRDADRLCVVDEALATLLWERVRKSGILEHREVVNLVPFGVSNFAAPEDKREAATASKESLAHVCEAKKGRRRRCWRPVAINACMRLSAYRAPSSGFVPHYDSPFVHSDSKRSALSIIIYLNETFEGGATLLWPAFSSDMPGLTATEEQFLKRSPLSTSLAVSVQPVRGSALFLPHTCLHAGAPVANRKRPSTSSTSSTSLPPSVKYILRTDLVYARENSDSGGDSHRKMGASTLEARDTQAFPGLVLNTFRDAQRAELAGQLDMSGRLYERSLSMRRSNPLHTVTRKKARLAALAESSVLSLTTLVCIDVTGSTVFDFCFLGDIAALAQVNRACFVAAARYRDLFWARLFRRVHARDPPVMTTSLPRASHAHRPLAHAVDLAKARKKKIAAQRVLNEQMRIKRTNMLRYESDEKRQKEEAKCEFADADVLPKAALRSRAYAHLYIPTPVHSAGCQTHYQFQNAAFVEAHLEACVRVVSAYALYSFGWPTDEDSFVVCHDASRNLAQRCSVEWLLTCAFYQLPCRGAFYHLYKTPALDMRAPDALRTCGSENRKLRRRGLAPRLELERQGVGTYARAEECGEAKVYCYSSKTCANLPQYVKDGHWWSISCSHLTHAATDGHAEARSDILSAKMPEPGRRILSSAASTASGSPPVLSEPTSLFVARRFESYVERAWLSRDTGGTPGTNEGRHLNLQTQAVPGKESRAIRLHVCAPKGEVNLHHAPQDSPNMARSHAPTSEAQAPGVKSAHGIKPADGVKPESGVDDRGLSAEPVQGYNVLEVRDRAILRWADPLSEPPHASSLLVASVRLNNVIADFSSHQMEIKDAEEVSLPACACQLGVEQARRHFKELNLPRQTARPLRAWRVSLENIPYQRFSHAGGPSMGSWSYWQPQDRVFLGDVRRMAHIGSRHSLHHLHVQRYTPAGFVATYNAVGAL